MEKCPQCVPCSFLNASRLVMSVNHSNMIMSTSAYLSERLWLFLSSCLMVAALLGACASLPKLDTNGSVEYMSYLSHDSNPVWRTRLNLIVLGSALCGIWSKGWWRIFHRLSISLMAWLRRRWQMFRCFLVKCMFLVFVHLSIPVDEGNIVSVDCG